MASSFGYRQDLPPKGGFNPIDFTKRVTYKKTNGFKILGIFLGIKVVGWFYAKSCVNRQRLLDLEQKDSRLAESVFRLAETDRIYLKHLRDMREEEKELMKDVPGWKVGTFFGEPLYHREKRQFMMPPKIEHNALENDLNVTDYIELKMTHKNE